MMAWREQFVFLQTMYKSRFGTSLLSRQLNSSHRIHFPSLPRIPLVFANIRQAVWTLSYVSTCCNISIADVDFIVLLLWGNKHFECIEYDLPENHWNKSVTDSSDEQLACPSPPSVVGRGPLLQLVSTYCSTINVTDVAIMIISQNTLVSFSKIWLKLRLKPYMPYTCRIPEVMSNIWKAILVSCQKCIGHLFIPDCLPCFSFLASFFFAFDKNVMSDKMTNSGQLANNFRKNWGFLALSRHPFLIQSACVVN